MDVLKNKYAKFDGRARRAEYWYFTLFSVLAYLIPYFIFFLGISMESQVISGLGMLLLVLVALGLLIPSLAVCVRRLHDLNKSGWNYFIGLIPFVGGIILLVWFCTEGNRFTNNYGPDPKGESELSDIGKSELV